MLEKPPIRDEMLADILHAHYGLAVPDIAFLPIGYDASAWAYRATAADGQQYFLKLRRGTVHAAPAAIACYLKDHGVESVVAPIQTTTCQLSAALDGYALLLYPWIDGRTGAQADGGLTDDQLIAYGAIVRHIHQARLPDDLAAAIPTEDFVLKHHWGGFIRRLSATIQQQTCENLYEREFATLWRAHEDEIMRVVERGEMIGGLLRRQPMHFVLCHADIHTSNLLVASDGDLHVIDWDQPVLAPRERDLMFVVGSDLTPTPEETLFFAGYGAVEVDALALAYYRFEWCVQEFADFAERVFLMSDVGDETKANSVRGFSQLFDPGDVVEQARNIMRLIWLE